MIKTLFIQNRVFAVTKLFSSGATLIPGGSQRSHTKPTQCVTMSTAHGVNDFGLKLLKALRTFNLEFLI